LAASLAAGRVKTVIFLFLSVSNQDAFEFLNFFGIVNAFAFRNAC
jgi:hypothetical protein